MTISLQRWSNQDNPASNSFQIVTIIVTSIRVSIIMYLNKNTILLFFMFMKIRIIMRILPLNNTRLENLERSQFKCFQDELCDLVRKSWCTVDLILIQVPMGLRSDVSLHTEKVLYLYKYKYILWYNELIVDVCCLAFRVIHFFSNISKRSIKKGFFELEFSII